MTSRTRTTRYEFTTNWLLEQAYINRDKRPRNPQQQQQDRKPA